MKKKYLLLIICLSIISKTIAQNCLPDGITFASQEEIDDFQDNYPGCIKIEGQVVIEGGDIFNLNGLSQLQTVDQSFIIRNCHSLSSLDGLENLDSIGYFNNADGEHLYSFRTGLAIKYNPLLNNLSALAGLKSIEGALEIKSNDVLTSLEGLEGLSQILRIHITNNHSLISLAGLDNLEEVFSCFTIGNNDALISLNGLENLISVDYCVDSDFFGDLCNATGFGISGNNALISLDGLNNLKTVGGCLEIGNNEALTSFEGLENLNTVGYCPGYSFGDCVYEDDIKGFLINGNNSLSSLTGLGNLQTVIGHFSIESNNDLTSLDGLENLDSLGGCLYINDNGGLISLGGLEKLDTIMGCLSITGNSSLNSLTGMEQLKTIGGANLQNPPFPPPPGSCNSWFLEISDNSALTSLNGLNNLSAIRACLIINNNESLVSLNGLEALTYVQGCYYYDCTFYNSPWISLEITGNSMLSSLNGLETVLLSSEDSITIINNPSLSACDAPPICTYLENGGDGTIVDNAMGCNGAAEVDLACSSVSVTETIMDEKGIQLYPNPTKDIVHFRMEGQADWEINLRNALGMLIAKKVLTGKGQIDFSNLPGGLYFLEFRNKGQIFIEKIIKE